MGSILSVSGSNPLTKENTEISSMFSQGIKSAIPSFNGIPRFKRGGTVKKTGLAVVHKGEKVLTKAQAKLYKKNK